MRTILIMSKILFIAKCILLYGTFLLICIFLCTFESLFEISLPLGFGLLFTIALAVAACCASFTIEEIHNEYIPKFFR